VEYCFLLYCNSSDRSDTDEPADEPVYDQMFKFQFRMRNINGTDPQITMMSYNMKRQGGRGRGHKIENFGEYYEDQWCNVNYLCVKFDVMCV
jgi:hypothetical protein